MAIWKNNISIEEIRNWCKGRLMERLGIEYLEVGEDYLKGRMPVDHRTMQPTGLLHGGASAALAESLGNAASSLCIDLERQQCVGLEINANHISSVREGYVYGVARPIHLGRTTHLWDIRIESEQGRLVCISRFTIIILEHKPS